MLVIKVRVIPQLLLSDGLLKKPVQFKKPRTVANPISIARVFETRQVDELMLLDIGCAKHNTNFNRDILSLIAEELTVPLAVGGGVNNLETVAELIGGGAEKIVINTAAVETPELITAIAEKFGSQSIVVSIDALKNAQGEYEVFVQNGQHPTGLDPVAWAMETVERGAGELIVNSIAQDGAMDGYDIPLIKSVAEAVSVPVIAAGGASGPDDCVKAILQGRAAAVSISSLFLFRRITPIMIKDAMADAGIPVRRSETIRALTAGRHVSR
ncbi:MAG: imidazole glycerol phosphate synthase subunit HisF [Rhodospirillaceae bacterium]|jgi:cyclase|nr:imidazole glycerol phosphate synthase subunit HisF [Rhodospirillaceae bacterium]MBT5667353.1 imidazole glycerol phosphate synthase subunit HisF [Rhodospirillaceae bacterium]